MYSELVLKRNALDMEKKIITYGYMDVGRGREMEYPDLTKEGFRKVVQMLQDTGDYQRLIVLSKDRSDGKVGIPILCKKETTLKEILSRKSYDELYADRMRFAALVEK